MFRICWKSFLLGAVALVGVSLIFRLIFKGQRPDGAWLERVPVEGLHEYGDTLGGAMERIKEMGQRSDVNLRVSFAPAALAERKFFIQHFGEGNGLHFFWAVALNADVKIRFLEDDWLIVFDDKIRTP